VEQVKIVDFGLACDDRGGGPLAAADRVFGTPGYMAPEQARGALAIDARVDVFSLGCVLFECLTGQPAFRGRNLLSIMTRMLLDEVPRVRALRDELPPSLEALLRAMLSRSPSRRPSDGAAIRDALGHVRIDASCRALPPLPLPARQTPTVRGYLALGRRPPAWLGRHERPTLPVFLPPFPALVSAAAHA